MVHLCNSTNTADVAQYDFWSFTDGNKSAHEIGWEISGACAAVVSITVLLDLDRTASLQWEGIRAMATSSRRDRALQNPQVSMSTAFRSINELERDPVPYQRSLHIVKRPLSADLVERVLLTFITTCGHAFNYRYPAQQRNVIRILWMPAVYAVISFFSYRYFRKYEYYSLAETGYEGVCLSAFLLLLVSYVGDTTSSNKAEMALQRKEKLSLPFTFGKLRVRASKPKFLHIMKWSVLQYVIFRPLLSIIGIICEHYNVLCSQMYSPYFAEVYLDAFDFVVISIALYGLVVFYHVVKVELRGRKPLAKFLSIKMIVFFTFYQGFVFSVLQDYNVIKGTEYWTATNVSDGLQALCTCIEMVIFAAIMMWAFTWKEYDADRLSYEHQNKGNPLRAIWDALWPSDFASELYHSTVFFVDFMRGKPHTRGSGFNDRMEAALGEKDDHDLSETRYLGRGSPDERA